MRDKTYLLGSSEAMKYEPRLDEEYYLDSIDNSLAKLKVNMKELEDSYLEDSITEQAEDGAFYYNQLVEETRR
jgi:hypothetical protein